MDTDVELSRVSKSFGEQQVLSDISVTIPSGSFFGLLGPNGAGKTTLLSLVYGQLRADSGTVTVKEVDVSQRPLEGRSRLGLLPEKESPPDYFTPREYFYFVGGIRDIDRDVLDDRIEEWSQRLQYETHLDTRSSDLSRGQQQKVMMTQAFLHEPPIVIIDEPLANLDPLIQQRVKSYLAEYHEQGNTLILSTHHIEVAQELCEEVVILNQGEVVTSIEDTSDVDLTEAFSTAVQSDSEHQAVEVAN